MKNYFASFIPAVKAILGIEAWSKDADKKDALLEEQKQKLKALNFNDTFGQISSTGWNGITHFSLTSIFLL